MAKLVKECRFCVVKRAGHGEEFDERKTYASCYAACISASISKKRAEQICELVVSAVKKHLAAHKEIGSSELFKFITRELKKHEPNAAFMYETHRDIA
jgi:transcriptional regulator NrdR family protein